MRFLKESSIGTQKFDQKKQELIEKIMNLLKEYGINKEIKSIDFYRSGMKPSCLWYETCINDPSDGQWCFWNQSIN